MPDNKKEMKTLQGARRGTCEEPAWWTERESNPRHKDFQSFALPTELSVHESEGKYKDSGRFCKKNYQPTPRKALSAVKQATGTGKKSEWGVTFAPLRRFADRPNAPRPPGPTRRRRSERGTCAHGTVLATTEKSLFDLHRNDLHLRLFVGLLLLLPSVFRIVLCHVFEKDWFVKMVNLPQAILLLFIKMPLQI